MGVHDAKVGFWLLGRYVAPLVSDGLSGWFATRIRGCPSEDADDFFLVGLVYETAFLGVWELERGILTVVRMHGRLVPALR